ncbi:hypothetical protein [Lucifera butyrica]|nr:hypothetical protein [Lucifera butyrica]
MTAMAAITERIAIGIQDAAGAAGLAQSRERRIINNEVMRSC